MDKNKIKLKYLLGIWKTLPSYPTSEDIVYEIKSFLLKEGKSGGEISQQNLKSIFGSDYENKTHGNILSELIQSGEIEEKVKGQQNKVWYKLRN